RTSLIQTMGRAARHIEGRVILYADTLTNSIKEAIAEVERRRQVQLTYNETHGISPQSVIKPVRSPLAPQTEEQKEPSVDLAAFDEKEINALTPFDKQKLIKKLKTQMRRASRDLDFELAARLRDLITSLS
ncbi:MAG: UvrB/UvrC motif-containing protein, partial [Patescibacteria group bacterium]